MELDPWQMPFFEWHPLSEEFDRRLRTVGAWIERLWPKYKNEPQRLAEKVFGSIEIYPLQLLLEQTVIKTVPDGYCEGSLCYRYDHYIPYIGDDILWNLSPYGLLKLPEGEVFRRTLILVFSCYPEVAHELFRTALTKIVNILQAQAREIDAFHATLRARIDDLLSIARETGLHALPS